MQRAKIYFFIVAVCMDIIAIAIQRVFPDMATWIWRQLLVLGCLVMLIVIIAMFCEFIFKYECVKQKTKEIKKSPRLLITTLIISFVLGGLVIWASGDLVAWIYNTKEGAKDYSNVIKKPAIEQKVDRKNKIIKQLDQFVQDGKAIKSQIESMHSNEFLPKHDLAGIKEELPIELEFKEWSNKVYIYLHNNVLAWAEDYKGLHAQVADKNLRRNMSWRDAYPVAMKEMADSHIEKIIEIIKSVNSSSN